MKILPTLLLSVLVGGALSATPFTVSSQARSSGVVVQTHGAIGRPANVCGTELYAWGAPGTHFKVFVDYPSTGRSELVYSGLMPTGGFFAATQQFAGCSSEPAVERGIIRSVSRSKIGVELTFE